MRTAAATAGLIHGPRDGDRQGLPVLVGHASRQPERVPDGRFPFLMGGG